MKVILNKDLSPLGEEGDVKDVARGYARNYLFPRMIAVPYNEGAIRLFEARKGDIEARKAEKRESAKGLKEKLEALELNLSMPAGANGRLFGSVTSQTVAEELNRQGFQIERKRIELPGITFKSVGKYKATVHLYESAAAEISITVQALVEKTAEAPARGRRRRPGEARPAETVVEAAPAEAGAAPAAESPAPAEAGAVPAAESPAPAEAGAAPAAEVPAPAEAGAAPAPEVPAPAEAGAVPAAEIPTPAGAGPAPAAESPAPAEAGAAPAAEAPAPAEAGAVPAPESPVPAEVPAPAEAGAAPDSPQA